MPVLDLDGLIRYDENIKNYIGRFANWQKSQKAGAVAIYPVPETTLETTVDFLFTETGPASGDKGPDNPSAITGVSSVKVTRCGKNLIQFSSSPYESTKSGITLTSNGDGSYTLNGTATAQVEFNFLSIDLHAGTYMLSGCPSGGSESTFSLATTGGVRDYGSGATVVLTSRVGRSPWIQIESGVTVSNLVFKPQLELGSTVTSFEPYAGTDYTIQLGNTYYGGEIDLATGLMTVTHKAVVLTGSESWNSQTINEYFRCYVTIDFHRVENLLCSCTHYQVGYGVDKAYINNPNGNACLFIGTDGTLEDLKAFLAEQYANGTPVVFVAQIPESEYTTVQLDPVSISALAQADKYTPRLNTVYTDASAVQVGYVKSPIRSEYELTQAIIATEGGE